MACHAGTLTANFGRTWSTRSAFRYSRKEWAEVVRHTFEGIGEVSEELFNAIYDRFAEASAWLVYEDVMPALQALAEQGVRLAVISNWDERLPPLLDQLGLATYFDPVIASAALGAHKPDERIFLHAAELLKVRPHQILHVGDSWREDVDGARSAGMAAVRIRRSGLEREGDIAVLTEIPLILEKTINRLFYQ